ncbi:DUF5985 family protein [Bradyrhizobium sp. 2]|uniref:DUF5985 family protein n=1 Tax=unclassified Bradyrhizobium TaxID=2631580 RepID=UPI001FFB451F|nr:DUF5985 family protein [Bradyrhizobium sp. 2]MCK1462967.1 hypothetical protein [Bradyrhizobium sp. 2]
MGNMISVLTGAIAMAGGVAALFFLKFWRRTNDTFFLLFAAAFAIDAFGRFLLAVVQVSDTTEPIYFLPRLVMFALIALAIVRKNAPRA